MVGNIGSGKSTIVNTIKNHGFLVVSRDAIRYMFGSGQYVFDKERESAVFNCEKLIIDELMDRKMNIIVDEVGVSKRLRMEYLISAKYHEYDAYAIEMPRLSMEESVSRRMQNPHGNYTKPLWEDVWKKFDKIYEPPTVREGFAEVIRLPKDKNNIMKIITGNK